ncbi:MAG: single-stranded DNA-binding protein [Selenomonadaceae bacterium]|nr:single-stranded DNA-binding protein [Selenomonadaceae bacterium]
MNRVIITGNLARDPEVRYTQSGKAVASLVVAVNRSWKRPVEGQTQNSTDFINVVAWDKSAEFCGKYLSKGRKVLVEGRIQSRSYETQDGSKRYITEVVSDNIEFMDSKRQDSDGGYSNSSYGHSGYSSDRSSDPSFSGGDDMIDSGNSKGRDGDIDIPF